MSNKGIESVPVEATGSVQGLKSITTDEEGFAEVGPFIPGESFTAQVTQEDFDDVSQVITTAEDGDLITLKANPTSPDMSLILTWGPSPSDLDAQVRFFDASGNEVCKLYWKNKDVLKTSSVVTTIPLMLMKQM